jgi:outer membrane biosynthesis protein TonB
MLNQLIESKSSSSENNSRAGFLISTTAFVALFACCAMLWSLFAKDIVSANDSLEMASLVAPVPIAETVPPKPEPIKKEVSETKSQSNETKIATRQVLIARPDESPRIPDKVSTVQNTSKSRPNGAVKITDGVETEGSNPTVGNGRNEGNGVTGTEPGERPTRIIKKTPIIEDTKDDPPPTVKKPIVAEVKPKVEPVKSTVSKGVINGSAINLPKPAFTAAAKAVGASGAVNVQVSIDENGNVTSARAVSGHPLLRAVSEAAARNAKFTQTFLSNQPVKVTGVIVYNFVR